jgi:hypothetical protein
MNPTEPTNQNDGQPTYVDPITGSPMYIDPATGQLSYGATPAAGTPTGNPVTPTDPAAGTPPTTAYPYGAATPPATGYPATGYPAATPGYAYPATTPAGGYSYPLSAYGYGYGQVQRKTNGLAIGALVTGIAALPLSICYGVGGIIAGLVGAILGHVARRKIRERGEDGGGMALAGIICGYLGVLLGAAVLILVIYIGIHRDEFQTVQ